MKNKESKHSKSFIKPAVYKIKVLGDLHETYTEKLGGLQINVEWITDKETVSILVGQINDQAALSGILNTLYDMHYTILSVNIMKDL